MRRSRSHSLTPRIGRALPGSHLLLTPCLWRSSIMLDDPAHIAENTAGLWARLRQQLAPETPLASQDLLRLVRDTLTSNELAHSVYWQVDAVIDQVAEDLVATGDWR